MIKVRHMAHVCREAMAAVHGTEPWDALNDRQRRLSLTVVNFILAAPDATPRSVHYAWMGEMIHNEGWQFGVYDEAAKRHPNLVEYEELDDVVIDAYAISIGIVRGMQAIGDRYENCAPPQATPVVNPTVDAPAAEALVPPTTQAIETGNGLTPEEIAALAPVVPSDAQFRAVGGPPVTLEELKHISDTLRKHTAPSQDGMYVTPHPAAHFSGHNQIVEPAPESGDVVESTDPARAE